MAFVCLFVSLLLLFIRMNLTILNRRQLYFVLGLIIISVVFKNVSANKLLVDESNSELLGDGSTGVDNNDCPSKCSCLGDYLDCTKLNLRAVPVVPDWISSLELSQNKLADDHVLYIRNLSKLNDLKLNKNRLENFPIFIGLNSLVTLQLAQNKIKQIPPSALLTLPELTSLDLSKNLIKTILPNSFPSRNKLVFLNLNFNDINTLEPNSLTNLRHLNELKLNHNSLGHLPPGLFGSFKKLKRLELNGNTFSEIQWATFSNLTDLKVLKMRNNNIKDLTIGAFHGLTNLHILELDNNRLTELTKGNFFNLAALNSLSLSNNSITTIGLNTWEYSTRLLTLDLSSNKLSTIYANTFESLNLLRDLNVNNNNLSMISEGAFNSTPNLVFLELRDNKLSSTIEDVNAPFQVLNKLDRLCLSGNEIKSINQNAFVGLLSLTHLDLTENNITTIQNGTFNQMPSFKELLMNTSSLICDCNLLWYYKWIQKNGDQQLITAHCSYPIQMRGKNVTQLNENEFTCNETPNPRIIVFEPLSKLAVLSTNFSFLCEAISSSSSSMKFKWKHDNVELNSEDTIQESSYERTSSNNTIATSVLWLNNVISEHAGRYQCVVTNKYGSTYSQKIKITVASLPTFNKIPTNLTVNSKATARLDCAATGDPQPQIAWQKDGGNDFPAARERRMHVMPKDDAFFIINAKVSDQGVYTCTAENPAGVIKANATLTIHEIPSFVKPMENKTVTTGKSAVLECMASGAPKPQLRWLKDGEPIEITQRHFFAADDQLLIIVETQKSDAGVYTCEMQNILGSDIGVMKLWVQSSPLGGANVNIDEMTGIVIITIVCCAVGTSIIWVVIIYQTKKGPGGPINPSMSEIPNGQNHPHMSAQYPAMYSGLNSLMSNGHIIINESNGENIARNNDCSLVQNVSVTNENDSLLDPCPKHHIIQITTNPTTYMQKSNKKCNNRKEEDVDYIDENNSELDEDDVSSCKDSGTGDSAKRSLNLPCSDENKQTDDSLNNLYSDNDDESEICFIETDKATSSVSYNIVPTHKPLCEDSKWSSSHKAAV